MGVEVSGHSRLRAQAQPAAGLRMVASQAPTVASRGV